MILMRVLIGACRGIGSRLCGRRQAWCDQRELGDEAASASSVDVSDPADRAFFR
jgi:hypothetical protein